MTTDAIIMMVITLVGYVGGFTYFMAVSYTHLTLPTKLEV